MIFLIYPKYVGGKFISNCLALSKYCVVQNSALAKIDLKFKNIDQSYYDFKLNSILKSLPVKDQITNWSMFEFGCDKLYGINEAFYQDNDIKTIREQISTNKMLEEIQAHHKNSCTIVHDYRTLMKELVIFPNAKIIEFKNFDAFRKLSAQLKSSIDPTQDSTYNLTKEYHYKDQDFYQLESFVVDVDATFMEWYPFNQMMMLLYDFMGFDDYNSELVYKFWVAYTNLHR